MDSVLLIIERSQELYACEEWGKGGGYKMCSCGDDLSEEFLVKESIKMLSLRVHGERKIASNSFNFPLPRPTPILTNHIIILLTVDIR